MVNDISIIAGIIAVFILVGVCLPYVNSAFYTQGTDIGVEEFEESIKEGVPVDTYPALTPFAIFLSVLSMFFWTFGALPFWLEAIFMIMRIVLVLIIARNIWIGGGG